jgi:hypothetical protein
MIFKTRIYNGTASMNPELLSKWFPGPYLSAETLAEAQQSASQLTSQLIIVVDVSPESYIDVLGRAENDGIPIPWTDLKLAGECK